MAISGAYGPARVSGRVGGPIPGARSAMAPMMATDRKERIGTRLLDQGRDGRELVSGRAAALAGTHRGRRPREGGRIIDVGGGASVLVDRLLDLPFGEIAVLDISESALGKAKARLGERAERVRWVVADVTEGPGARDLRCLA